MSTRFFYHCPLWPWPLTLKINRCWPLSMGNSHAKFNEDRKYSVTSRLSIRFFYHSSLWHWPLTLKINRCCPLTIGNSHAKLYENCQVNCDLWSVHKHLLTHTRTHAATHTWWYYYIPSATKLHKEIFTVQKLCPHLKFLKNRSNSKVKVTGSKIVLPMKILLQGIHNWNM